MYIIYSIDMKILTIFITNLYRKIYLASKNYHSIIEKKTKTKKPHIRHKAKHVCFKDVLI